MALPYTYRPRGQKLRLHSVEVYDSDREAWLTETGATLLAIAARRYFVKMADLRDRFLSLATR